MRLTYCAIRWWWSDRLESLMSLNQMHEGRPDRKRIFLLSLEHPGMLQSINFKSFMLCARQVMRQTATNVDFIKIKGRNWHLPINSPCALQRRTLQSVDEVSTTWSLSTTCRLDENIERWDEGRQTWQDALNHWSSPAPNISPLLI